MGSNILYNQGYGDQRYGNPFLIGSASQLGNTRPVDPVTGAALGGSARSCRCRATARRST